jgi:nucleoside 2-deoxyribosyltransferase
MTNNENECPICGGEVNYRNNAIDDTSVDCKACGRFCLFWQHKINKNILASFLYYKSLDYKTHFYFIGPQEPYNRIQKKEPNTRWITGEGAETWYPKTFNDKINEILLGFAKMSKYNGDWFQLSPEQLYSAFFVKRYDEDGGDFGNAGSFVQLKFMIDYLISGMLISSHPIAFNEPYQINLLPEAFKRIDELQKNQSNSKDVFVAMDFSDDKKGVREAICKAIVEAGYNLRIMDEIQHNKQIVPEMLYQIKQSKFLIAEFSEQNRGVYFEAGYAAGLGKEVIHICREDKFSSESHFDVKQINFVLWTTEDDLTERLLRRIEALFG